MTLNLRLEYQTAYGEDLYVVVGTDKEKAYAMRYAGEGVWCAELKLTATTELVYRYEVRYPVLSAQCRRTSYALPRKE